MQVRTGRAGGTQIQIIGIDAATQPAKVGLARGRWAAGRVSIEECQTCSTASLPAAVVIRWLEDDPRSLIAIDAPLGWPDALREALPDHVAGRPLMPPQFPEETYEDIDSVDLRDRPVPERFAERRKCTGGRATSTATLYASSLS